MVIGVTIDGSGFAAFNHSGGAPFPFYYHSLVTVGKREYEDRVGPGGIESAGIGIVMSAPIQSNGE